MQDELKMKAKETYKKLGENRFILIKKNFYDDAEFEFDFNIGNEQLNPSAVAQNTQAVLSTYNPEFMADPDTNFFTQSLQRQWGFPW